MSTATSEASYKQAAAEAALAYLEDDMIVGVGTGSTVNYFIAALAKYKQRLEGAVASSIATADQLRALGIPLIDLNSVSELPLYVDGADEVNAAKQMIKGGGGALTREKLVATVAKKFVCIVDERKIVDRLGQFPVAVEVIPMARSFVARQIVQLGADPVYREGFMTDNENVILDVYNLPLLDPGAMELQLKMIPGVVESGVFSKRRADVVLVGGSGGVKKL